MSAHRSGHNALKKGKKRKENKMFLVGKGFLENTLNDDYSTDKSFVLAKIAHIETGY